MGLVEDRGRVVQRHIRVGGGQASERTSLGGDGTNLFNAGRIQPYPDH